MNKKILDELFCHSLEKLRWLLGFDRDGTLVPYADKSEAAILSPGLANKLIELGQDPKIDLAVISARGLKQLRQDVKQGSVTLAGNYGMEIDFADGRQSVQPQAVASQGRVQKAKTELLNLLGKPSEELIDDHGLSVCVHFHQLESQQADNIHQAISKLIVDFPDLRFRRLPTSYEILPDLDWDKGFAMAELEAGLQLNSKETFYLYVGDTSADESAFRFVNERNGVSLKVGRGVPTEAKYYLSDCREVEEVIDYLLAVHYRS